MLNGSGAFGLSFREQQELLKTLTDVQASEVAEPLEFMPKQFPKKLGGGLPFQLLARWAESDARGTMAHAKP